MRILQTITILGAVFGNMSCLFAGDHAVAADDAPVRSESGSWLENLRGGLHRFDIEVGHLESDDIDITQYAFQYELKQPLWNAALTLGYTDYSEDYRPAVIGSNTSLSENMQSIQAQFGWKLTDRWSVDATGRYYDGYAGYRSIWIAEYYRQVFGLFPGYEAPDPEGYSSSVGLVYSYASGHSVRGSVGYGRDTIAPGYGFGALGLTPSRDQLNRKSATLRFEDIWTPWLKSEHTLSYVDVTSRQERWQVKSVWHAALGDDWTLRLQAGYSEEGPQFEAKYGGVALEWNFVGDWYLSASAQVYEDTGEIPNAGLVTTAAPGIATLQYGVGLRWVGEKSAFRIYTAIYENDYDALSGNNQIFRNLYQDRDWTLVQVSYTYQF